MVATVATPDGVLRLIDNPIRELGREPSYQATPLLGEHQIEIFTLKGTDG